MAVLRVNALGDKPGPKGFVLGIDLQEVEPIAGAEIHQLDFLDAGADDKVKSWDQIVHLGQGSQFGLDDDCAPGNGVKILSTASLNGPAGPGMGGLKQRSPRPWLFAITFESAPVRASVMTMPAALTNSLTTTSAPKRRQSLRNGDSLTPAWGARNRGVRPLRRSSTASRPPPGGPACEDVPIMAGSYRQVETG